MATLTQPTSTLISP
uniref:Uncharacterized protein n=1 Tax=Anguilla anguilla TaxID=7936 RepID=A0A0E9SL61_ANGAN